MHEIKNRAAPLFTVRDPQKIDSVYGGSSMGEFIAAKDSRGVCVIFFGNNRAALLENLRGIFPGRILVPVCLTVAGFVVSAAGRLIALPRTSMIDACRGAEAAIAP